MYKLSVIILSYAMDDEVYHINRHAIESLLASEPWQDDSLEILLIESNKENPYRYDDLFYGYEKQAYFRIEIPQERFNFHRFINHGIQMTDGDFVAMCNNDIEFRKGWFRAILSVKQEHPAFMCFSPLDRTYPMMTEQELPGTQSYYIGWENKRHFAAWCFVWERKVFDIIGLLDETFDFYSADDDELQTLRYWAIPNVLVTGSEVKHLSQVVTKKIDKKNNPEIPEAKRKQYPLTDDEIKRGLIWLWEDERFYVAYQRMKKKWGSARMRERVNRFLERYPILNRRCVTKFLYNPYIINFMAKVTRAKG